ncbi:hypothetical protein ELZ19_07020 [Brucella abortus]|uniref:hypothetical protein n=1 Tax=Brucella abortus TaxID=235 RepID=UPI0004E96A94|nr:hypothetical protein [Brucella abortus]KFH18445.1 hypothetical protein IB60_17215 [Brucella abortus LMN1]RUQ67322.1 hypothetical protein ELZ23_15450 [Brucella abortus]RUQ78538.1 hypothetical protein ELZ22_17100 [Brucella abortus]RUQ88289.1 hypothetical protein ELZ18_15630 [Brucella abortus]RUQ90318.1 hypothetical protein ELZ20_15625 [Brucella abortus]
MDQATKIIMERTAEEAAEKAVAKAMTSLGIDHANPLEAQRDMQALRELRDMVADEDFQKDMMHLRRWRKAMEGVQNKGFLTVVGILVAGGCAAIWLGFQQIITGGR